MLGTGYVRDLHVFHDGALVGAPRAVGQQPDDVLTDADVGNQGRTEKCVGFSLTRAVLLAARILGLGEFLGSESALVNMTNGRRNVLLGLPNAPLVEEGCQPSLAVDCIRRYGLPSQGAFPFSGATSLDRVDLADLLDARKRIGLFVTSWNGIAGNGDAMVEQCRAVLRAGIPIPVALCSSRPEYQNAGSAPVDAPSSYQPTDHMNLLVRALDDGNFKILNSWGLDYGVRGCLIGTPGLIKSCDARYAATISKETPQ